MGFSQKMLGPLTFLRVFSGSLPSQWPPKATEDLKAGGFGVLAPQKVFLANKTSVFV